MIRRRGALSELLQKPVIGRNKLALVFEGQREIETVVGGMSQLNGNAGRPLKQ